MQHEQLFCLSVYRLNWIVEWHRNTWAHRFALCCHCHIKHNSCWSSYERTNCVQRDTWIMIKRCKTKYLTTYMHVWYLICADKFACHDLDTECYATDDSRGQIWVKSKTLHYTLFGEMLFQDNCRQNENVEYSMFNIKNVYAVEGVEELSWCRKRIWYDVQGFC